jgi:hypothetical protein
VAHPELGQVSLPSSSVQQGQPLSLNYTITNPNSATVPAVLGASIRPAGSKAWLNDAQNDRHVDLKPGSNTYTRVFRVPADFTTGTYDVAWGLISPDMQTNYGFQSRQSVLTVSSSQSITAAAGPQAAVTRFYSALGAHDLQTAWNLLSARARGDQNYATWSKGYASTRSAKLSDVRVVNQASDRATVSFTLESVDAQDGGGTIPKTFQGSWQLVQSNGAWLLDSPSIRQVS